MGAEFEKLIRQEGLRGLNKLITDFNQVKTLEAPPHSILVSPDGTVDPAVQVDNSGNVGIGTETPQARLHVAVGEGALPALSGGDGLLVQNNDDAADNAQVWLIGGTSGQSNIVFGDANRENNARIVVDHGDDSLRFYTNGVFRQIITGSTGRFGVQAFVPQAKVDILSNADKQLRLSFQGGVKFCDFDVNTTHDLTIQPSSTGQIILLPTTDSTDFFQVKDAAASVILNVDATNERVGVGTATPATYLYVLEAISTVYAQAVPSVTNCLLALANIQASESTDDQAMIQFNINGGSQNRAGAIGMIAENSGNRLGALVFCPDDGGTRAEAMRISGAGRVGMNGVTSPSTELDIGAGAMEFDEMTAPSAGAANTARLFAQDNGAGKTQLVVRFNTGAIQVLATEP